MFFIPLDTWISRTSSWRHSRSAELIQLDKAIDVANTIFDGNKGILVLGANRTSKHAANSVEMLQVRRRWALDDVQHLFTAWTQTQTAKNQDWRESVRNESGAMTELYAKLTHWRTRYPVEIDTEAVGALREAADNSIALLFKDCEVLPYADTITRNTDRYNKAKAARTAFKAQKLARGGYSGTPPAPGGDGTSLFAQKMGALTQEAFGVSIESLHLDEAGKAIEELVRHAISSIKDEIAAIIPGAGLAVASVTLAFGVIKLVTTSIAADNLADLLKKLPEGDSHAALDRVHDWLLQDVARCTAKVARAGVNVGMQTASILSAGAALPAQTAASIASALVALTSVVLELGLQYKQSRALTKYLNGLAGKPVDRQIFAISPLASAYYLLNTPTSFIALHFVEFGAMDWQTDVERLVKSDRMTDLIKQSARLIDASRYRIRAGHGVGTFREREGKTTWVKAQELVGREPLRGTTLPVESETPHQKQNPLLRAGAVRGTRKERFI